MKLTALGSGTLVARIDRGSPGFYLEVGDKKILMDMGPGTLRQLAKAGKSYRDIDIVIINHIHPDHVSDFASLIQALNWTPEFLRKKELIVIGGKGFDLFYQGLLEVFPDAKPKPDSFSMTVLTKNKYDFKDFIIQTKQGNHSPQSITIKITEGGRKLVYTGDTFPDHDLPKFASSPDLLITECSYPEGKSFGAHLNPKTAGEMARSIGAKKLLLTHFYPPVEKTDIIKEVNKYYKGEVILAKDFLTITI